MRFRDNVILQYSLITLFVVAIVSTALGVTVSSAIKRYQLQSHVRLYPEIIRLAMSDSEGLYAALEPGGSVSPDAEKLLRGFLSLGMIFRVKVWNSQATIVWSDRKELIGKRFEDDGAFHIAMGGNVTYGLGTASGAENMFERDRGTALQIYAPLGSGGRVLGVLELYEANGELFAEVERNTRIIWFMVVAAGIAMYLLLFLVFYRSYEAQARAKAQIIETQNITIYALAYQAELRDRETGRHLERTAKYVCLLAEEMARLPMFKGYLTPQYIDDLARSAPLHDIGKIGVPDAILLKPGKLTGEETRVMRTHCELGAHALSRAQQKLRFQTFLTIAVQLTIGHHEKWNGKGYPQGLFQERIPISARIMALADVQGAVYARGLRPDNPGRARGAFRPHRRRRFPETRGRFQASIRRTRRLSLRGGKAIPWTEFPF